MEFLNATPYYKKIKQELNSRIQQGEWKEGDRLPSEKKLCEEFGVSRITIRQAILQGVNEGFLETYRGKARLLKRGKLLEDLSKVKILRR